MSETAGWPWSWLPFKLPLPSFELSNIALPTSMQRRFISFVLKRSLGHLLKPGQLDIDQIDTQIGSGMVEVKDLELDPDAINVYLADLPLRMQSGSIGKVTAHIPWPNPFSSSLGLSVSNLRLFLIIVDTETPHTAASATLADSVASVADNFIHEELSTPEEASLRTSFHPDIVVIPSALDDESHGLPGSMDPFLHDNGGEQHNRKPNSDPDPVGISVFASLLERLLAKFQFDGRDMQITLIHSLHTSYSLTIAEMQYGAEMAPSSVPSEPSVDNATPSNDGQRSTMRLTGLKLSMRDLTPSRPPSSVISSPSSRTASPSRSVYESDIDEETQMLMSQSIVSLPPAPCMPPSPSHSMSSDTSSIYQSALADSTVSTNRPFELQHVREMLDGDSQGDDDDDDEPRPDELILSFGSEPVIISLTMHALLQPPATDVVETHQNGPSVIRQSLNVNVTTGIIACCLEARHLSALLDLSARIIKPSHRQLSQENTHNDGLTRQLDCGVQMRGFVALILPSAPKKDVESSLSIYTNVQDPLVSFFIRPLLPPELHYDYVRLHIDTVNVLLFSPPSLSIPFTGTSPRPLLESQTLLKCTIVDISILAFTPGINSSPIVSSPILITDPHLASPYMNSTTHSHSSTVQERQFALPKFDVTDWTQGGIPGAGVKIWRTKVPQTPHRRKPGGSSPGFVSNVDHFMSPPSQTEASSSVSTPAVTARLSTPSSTHCPSVDVHIVPLHLFFDLGSMSRLVNFLDDVDPMRVNTFKAASDTIQEDVTERDPGSLPQATARVSDPGDGRGHRLEPQDPDNLYLNYQQPKKSQETSSRLANNTAKFQKGLSEAETGAQISVQILGIRLEVRVPPPPCCTSRSGALILDLHELHVNCGHSDETVSERPHVQSEWSEGRPSRRICATIATVQARQVVIAYSLVNSSNALAVLSVGSLIDKTFSKPETSFPQEVPLIPRLTVQSEAQTRNSSLSLPSLTTSLRVDLPSAYVCLSKPYFDGLQLWADDVSQLMERLTPAGRAMGSGSLSRVPSMIGSRYFARRAASASSETSTSLMAGSGGIAGRELSVKTTISELAVRLILSKEQSDTDRNMGIFDITASDMVTLIEVHPRGKEETAVMLSVLQLSAAIGSEGAMKTIISPTQAQTVNSIGKHVVKISLKSLTVPETTIKESKIRATLCGLMFDLSPDIGLLHDIGLFVKSPPGAFESVIPSERTCISVKFIEVAVRITIPSHTNTLLLALEELELATTLVGTSSDTTAKLVASAFSILLVDDSRSLLERATQGRSSTSTEWWKMLGYALLFDVNDLELQLQHEASADASHNNIVVDRLRLGIHLCADSISGISTFASNLASALRPADEVKAVHATSKRHKPNMVSHSESRPDLLRSLDEDAFRRVPELGPAPDMIDDDLPSNLEYLDASFGAAAGLRELPDDDSDDEFILQTGASRAAAVHAPDGIGVVSDIGGETVKMFRSSIQVVENFYDNLPPESLDDTSEFGETQTRLRLQNCELRVFLYQGYDWTRTRKAIEEERKQVRKRLARIRQLLASGQAYDPSMDDTSTLLFNSVYVGLEQDIDELEPGALITAIDEELKEDLDTASQNSWQTLRPPLAGLPPRQVQARRKRLHRSRMPCLEFCLSGLNIEAEQYKPAQALLSRILFSAHNLEILDHLKTSTWKTFLTSLRTDSQGNTRESDSNMVRVELRMLQPTPGHPEQEARLKAKLLPLRLHVDQDALDFMKVFFSFKDAEAEPSAPSDDDIYFQHVEVFPVDIKLDYKPRRVDYRALREGRTIELMNFFHFDGAEMTLRHITLKGISGWPRLFDLLNDLWTPDVKANQLVDVVSGVSPIRSVVNVGSGVADLVLLPIAQYKKDGRIIRGLQKGTNAFVKSTAMEAIRLGAQLATGTQVILEQAESVLGGQFRDTITAEAFEIMPGQLTDVDGREPDDLISRYAEQPVNIKEGVRSAYQSLSKNVQSAGQTILAVPMEVYERSGTNGPARAVIRAVPIAVLKPMIGASEAVSKTLLGLRNSLDPNARHDDEAKYKQR